MTQAAGEILRLFDTEIFGKERKLRFFTETWVIIEKGVEKRAQMTSN